MFLFTTPLTSRFFGLRSASSQFSAWQQSSRQNTNTFVLMEYSIVVLNLLPCLTGSPRLGEQALDATH